MIYYSDQPIEWVTFSDGERVATKGPGWYCQLEHYPLADPFGPYPTEEKALIAEHKSKADFLERKHENFKTSITLTIVFVFLLLSGGGCSLIGLGM